ncbi:MAG TPA: 50S ribosomal protein L24 [Myxococcota bacterium]|nr:50S ribosomal protein L24 [Myxococcota bacterium]HOH75863.1 50S ribosomal protein L24 [Myxococcota bacterium]
MRKIRKGDQVQVLRGKDAGRKGKVLEIIGETDKAVVENVNMVKKHTKKTQKNLTGGIVEKAAPLPLSALAVLSKKDGKPVRVHFETRETAGKATKVRVASRTGEVLD